MAAALLLAACARPSAALEEKRRWRRDRLGAAGNGDALAGGGAALSEMSELAQNGAGQETVPSFLLFWFWSDQFGEAGLLFTPKLTGIGSEEGSYLRLIDLCITQL